MLFLIRLSIATATAIASAMLLGWTEPYPLHLGRIPAAVFAAIAVGCMWKTRTVLTPKIRMSGNPLREVFLGLVTAAVWVGATAFAFWVLNGVSYFPPAICDRNRPYIEQDMRDLEQRKQYRAAAAVGLKELDAVHTPEWTAALAQWTIRLLCLAAESVDSNEAQSLIDQALKVAARHQAPDDLPRLVQKQLGERLQADRAKRERDQVHEQLQRATEAKASAEQKLAAADKKAAEHEAAAAALRRQREEDAANHQAALAEGFAQLCTAADHGGAGDLASLRTTLADAAAQAARRHIPLDEAKAVLRRLDERLAATRPADLSAGVTGRVVRSRSGGMPGLLLVDVELRLRNGTPLEGLVNKDFVAGQGGAPLRLAAQPRRQTTTLYVQVLVDISGSTRGEPQRWAQAGIATLIRQLPHGAFLRCTSFNDRVSLLADWSQDRTAALTACQRVVADGGTALFVAIKDAIQSFTNITGKKEIVCFSDGANSLPGPSQEELIAAARAQGITVHFVALKRGRDDTTAIEAIARGTGGQSQLVDRSNELVASFQALAAQLTEEGYRLAVLDCDATKPLSVRVGSQNAVQLTVPPASAAPPHVVATPGG